jgi:tetratricopeptide (TPR) repeat protein
MKRNRSDIKASPRANKEPRKEAAVEQDEKEDDAYRYLSVLVAATQPPSLQEYIGHAMGFVQAQNYADSIALLNKAILSYPDSSKPHHVLGSIYLELDNPNAAIEHFQKAIDLNQPGSQNHDVSELAYSHNALGLAWGRSDYRQLQMHMNIARQLVPEIYSTPPVQEAAPLPMARSLPPHNVPSPPEQSFAMQVMQKAKQAGGPWAARTAALSLGNPLSR